MVFPLGTARALRLEHWASDSDVSCQGWEVPGRLFMSETPTSISARLPSLSILLTFSFVTEQMFIMRIKMYVTPPRNILIFKPTRRRKSFTKQ